MGTQHLEGDEKVIVHVEDDKVTFEVTFTGLCEEDIGWFMAEFYKLSRRRRKVDKAEIDSVRRKIVDVVDHVDMNECSVGFSSELWAVIDDRGHILWGRGSTQQNPKLMVFSTLKRATAKYAAEALDPSEGYDSPLSQHTRTMKQGVSK
jgi:hypothetical protein